MALKELLLNKDRIHTTDLGIIRIKKNLNLNTDDVVAWCKNKIFDDHTIVTRQGKNWYAKALDCIITINAYSYTIITAHIIEK